MENKTASLTVLSITVMTGSGPDKILCELDAPCGTWPYQGNASARIECAAGSAEKWIEANGLGSVPRTKVEV